MSQNDAEEKIERLIVEAVPEIEDLPDDRAHRILTRSLESAQIPGRRSLFPTIAIAAAASIALTLIAVNMVRNRSHVGPGGAIAAIQPGTPAAVRKEFGPPDVPPTEKHRVATNSSQAKYRAEAPPKRRAYVAALTSPNKISLKGSVEMRPAHFRVIVSSGLPEKPGYARAELASSTREGGRSACTVEESAPGSERVTVARSGTKADAQTFSLRIVSSGPESD
jgi:hypothetical protein